MSELVRHRPDGTFNRKTTVQIDRRESQNLGTGLTEGFVQRVGVTIMRDEDKTRDVQLAEKVFDHPELTPEVRKEAISKILKIHTELKERGLPTIPTMRTEVGNDQSIFMTDLTQNGKNEVVSVPDWYIHDSGYGNAPIRKGKFRGDDYKIEILNTEEISRLLAELFKQSIEKNCKIESFDTFFIIVDKKTKEGRIILGDLSRINFSTDPITLLDRRNLITENQYSFLEFVSRMNNFIQTQPGLSTEPLKQAFKGALDQYNINLRSI